MQPCDYFLAHFQSCVILGGLLYKQEIHVRCFSKEPQFISLTKMMQRISSGLSLQFLSGLQWEQLQLKVNYCKIMGEQLRIHQINLEMSKIIQGFLYRSGLIAQSWTLSDFFGQNERWFPSRLGMNAVGIADEWWICWNCPLTVFSKQLVSASSSHLPGSPVIFQVSALLMLQCLVQLLSSGGKNT